MRTRKGLFTASAVDCWSQRPETSRATDGKMDRADLNGEGGVEYRLKTVSHSF